MKTTSCSPEKQPRGSVRVRTSTYLSAEEGGTYFKELAHMIVELASSKSAEQASMLETPGGVDTVA